MSTPDNTVLSLIKTLDDEIKEFEDKKYDLQFQLLALDEILGDKKALRASYKLIANGVIPSNDISKMDKNRLLRTRSRSPVNGRDKLERRLRYGNGK